MVKEKQIKNRPEKTSDLLLRSQDGCSFNVTTGVLIFPQKPCRSYKRDDQKN